MTKSFISIVILVLFAKFVQAQCPSILVINSQGTVNTFLTEYPGCTTLPGDVTISGDNITSLAPLIGLKGIKGNLLINTTNLTDLTGLDSLSFIGKDLNIWFTKKLVNLRACLEI